jgi:hypothetical protein
MALNTAKKITKKKQGETHAWRLQKKNDSAIPFVNIYLGIPEEIS